MKNLSLFISKEQGLHGGRGDELVSLVAQSQLVACNLHAVVDLQIAGKSKKNVANEIKDEISDNNKRKEKTKIQPCSRNRARKAHRALARHRQVGVQEVVGIVCLHSQRTLPSKMREVSQFLLRSLGVERKLGRELGAISQLVVNRELGGDIVVCGPLLLNIDA